VKAGDTVEEGDVVLIVEAMKMEYTLTAPRSGCISNVLAVVGDQVVVDAPLVLWESEIEAP
jgi:3-methylcrotonyl-CoA carboxylase alpha subunit